MRLCFLFLILSVLFPIKSQELYADSILVKEISTNTNCYYSTKNDTINGYYKVVFKGSVIEEGFINMGFKDGVCKKTVGENRLLVESYDLGNLKSAKFYSEGRLYYEEFYNEAYLEYSVLYHQHSSDTGGMVLNKLAWKGFVKSVDELR